MQGYIISSANVLIHRTIIHFYQVFNGLYRLTNTNTRPDKTSPEDEDWDEDKMHIAYDDPARYAKVKVIF